LRKKLSILVVSGTYPPDIGGSELSIHTACQELVKKGHQVTVIADDRRSKYYLHEDVPIYGVSPDNVDKTINKLHKIYRFDAIITQLIYSPQALRWGKKKKVPTIYFIRNNEMKLDLSPSSLYYPSVILANSLFIQSKSEERWKRKIRLIYPFIDLSKFIPNKKNPEYITMINPLVIKGGEIFYKIAQNFTNKKFLVVKGWTGLRNRKNFKWEPRQWDLIAKAHNDDEVHPPEEVDFSILKNVEVLKGVRDMRLVYAKTRILLFPSIWDEAFGRSIIEALASGIPVIAHNVGGVKETGIKRGGILLEKNCPIENWFEAINKLDDPYTYKKFSEAAIEDSKKYSLKKQIDKLERICFELKNL
jgi:glycosyltransferase involved in cell wall biosynthesis